MHSGHTGACVTELQGARDVVLTFCSPSGPNLFLPLKQLQAMESGQGQSCRECLVGIAPQGLLQQDPRTLQPSGEAYQLAVAAAAADASLQGCCGLGCEQSIFEEYATIRSECPTQVLPPLIPILIPMEAYGQVVGGQKCMYL